jgi:hypothetical protein
MYVSLNNPSMCSFIARVLIGIASSVCPVYVAENAPRGIRGLLTGFYQLMLVFGLTVGSPSTIYPISL